MTTPGLAPPPLEPRRLNSVPVVPVVRTRPVISLPRVRSTARVGGWPVVLSILIHAGALAALVLLLRLGPSLPAPQETESPRETVEYIDLDWPVGVPGDGAGAESSPAAEAAESTVPSTPRRQPGAAPLVFPGGVPSGIPAPAASSGVGTGEAAGAAAGGAGGAAERLRPGFRDARLYVNPADLPRAEREKSDHQKYMEHLNARIEASNDSAYAAARAPNTDWTFKDGKGRKWGVSEKGVHLGGVTVPRALVPVPRSTGTNQDIEKAREQQRQRDEIRRQEADRERREAREKAVKATRERTDAARETEKDPDG